jgi:hypothetical protein
MRDPADPREHPEAGVWTFQEGSGEFWGHAQLTGLLQIPGAVQGPERPCLPHAGQTGLCPHPQPRHFG